MHTTLVPAWFDPVDMPGVITPFMILYGLHDAVVKPMPGKIMTGSLAESWSASPDGLVYEFVLRKGVRFHICTVDIATAWVDAPQLRSAAAGGGRLARCAPLSAGRR